jgi:Transposase IS116/IS110/IS902 family/Protein of unknown function (DUF2867)
LGNLSDVRSGRAETYQLGDRVGIFSILEKTETELLLGIDDRHLDVRVSILKSNQGALHTYVVSTVASYAGLAPTPWQSGSVAREQGVAKAGNPRLRTTLIQLAWLWLHHQPKSALALWFGERVRRNGRRLKKTTIVALARKLLVALWKYVTAGVVIEGAVMKTIGR